MLFISLGVQSLAQILDPGHASADAVASLLSNLQNLRKSEVAKKKIAPRSRMPRMTLLLLNVQQWRKQQNGKVAGIKVSSSNFSLQNQSVLKRKQKADRRINAGRSELEDWKMHPFTKVSL